MAEREEVQRCDVLSGGFPCQDISVAGNGAGLDGERSGLWREYLRTIRVVRPKYAVVENVAALLNRGVGRVLGDLAESGYDAEWDCLPAVAFGAPHIRDRIWILAYPVQRNRSAKHGEQQAQRPKVFGRGSTTDVADTTGDGLETRWPATRFRPERFAQSSWWATEPDVGRVAHGIPNRVDRLKGLGNGVVPQIAEWIGRRIIEAEENK